MIPASEPRSDGEGELLVPRLIAGLGNPGRKYQGTRHNVGFMVVDRLVAAAGESWSTEKKWHCEVARTDSVTWIKPTTYMNLSGRAVSAVARFYKIEAEEILVIYDDADLPLGRLRLRAQGSAGGHNGIKSILAGLGTDSFGRLKVGIGSSRNPGDMVNHVLGAFASEEEEILEKSLQESMRAVECALARGLGAAMNDFNRKEKAKKPTKQKAPDTGPESSQEEGTGQQDHE